MPEALPQGPEAGCVLVTATVADQLVGLPIGRVRDVFAVPRLTPVPLAPPDVAGLLNLRGRVVTALDLRRRLGLPAPPDADRDRMAVGIEAGTDLYGLLVDGVGDIVTASPADLAPPPRHLDAAWAELTSAICTMDDRFMVVLDVDALLFPGPAGGPASPRAN